MMVSATMLKAYFVIRTVLAIGLLLLGLLVLVRAKMVWLFQLQLAATEYGHWFALAALSAAIAGPWKSFAAPASLLAFGLLMSSAVRAAKFAGKLEQSTEEAPAFSWKRLWLSPTAPTLKLETFVFATHDKNELKLNFFGRTEIASKPCVIVIHLGGWDNGTRAEFESFNQMLAGNGFAVASIDYRLAPKDPWPAQRDDVLDALHFLQANSEKLAISKEKFVLMGRSAGGQIASAVALGAPDPAIRGCIALYAPHDLNFAWSYADPNDILNSDLLLRQYLGGTPKEKAAEYDSSSGILFVTPQSIPMLLMHGTIDEMVWVKQSQRLDAKLTEAGVKHQFLELPWATHVFDYNLNGPGGQLTEWAVLKFLRDVTKAAH